ncbi:MAG: extracellular solute-binding protein, partial [Chloroflexota bacterium]|nr:extracellular solute-binding protein [Chloroflexota bacterium]
MTRREWLSLALITGTVLLPASCGGDEDEERPPQQEPSTGNANALEAAKELRQFTLAYLEHPYAVNPPKPSILGRDVKSGWDSGSIPGAREGSTLQLVPMPHKTDERYQLLGLATAVEYLRATAAADSSVADVVWLPSLAQIMELMRTELLAPLERWLQSDNANPLDAFSEEARRLVRVRGRIRGLPLSIAPGVLGHNASFFERANVAGPTPDWKWQDFIDAGNRLTVDANEDGDPEQYGFSLNWDFPDWEPLLLQEGGEIIDLDTGLISIEGPATERALTAWDELGRVHGMHPYGPEVTELDLRGFEDDTKPSAMRFSRFKKNPWSYRPDITPMPSGSNGTTPLSL